jgi:YbbR domain-containing protein
MNFLKNIPIKVLAVISALLLWFFVVGVENYVYLFPEEIPVRVINLGKNVSIANEISNAKIRYKGEPGSSNSLNPSEFELYIDAAGLSEGDYNLPIRYISKNSKVTIVAAEPKNIKLELEAITSKDISLETEVNGSPAKNYEVKSVKINLQKVKLSGAAKAIANIKELNLKITLDGSETADFSRKVTLEAPAEWKLAGKTVSFEPATVQVDIEVRKSTKPVVEENNSNGGGATPVMEGMQRKSVMAQVTVADPLKLSVKELLPINILVTVEGKKEDIDKLNNNSIRLQIPSPGVVNGTYKVNNNDLILPAGLDLKIIETSPTAVGVKLN